MMEVKGHLSHGHDTENSLSVKQDNGLSCQSYEVPKPWDHGPTSINKSSTTIPPMSDSCSEYSLQISWNNNPRVDLRDWLIQMTSMSTHVGQHVNKAQINQDQL